MFSMRTNRLCLLLLVTLNTAIGLKAQSLDPGKPTPIRSNSISGRIAARDLGDSRSTDHYYALIGTLGDLLITVNTRNLNGDLDVFTASGLRPLLKLSLYAESASPVTKGIYLRKREELILRIEARSPNDDEGTYQLSFGGSFEPIVGGPEISEAETTLPETPATGDPKTRRVSSVGARLPEPERPVTEVATAEPTPAPTPEATPTESPSPSPAERAETTPKAPGSRAPTRGRRPAGRRTTTSTPTPSAPRETESPVTAEPKKEEAAEVPEPSKPKTSTRGTSKRGSATARAKTPESAPEPEPETGPRLVIETNDGTLINRSMSTVRRVMVENGQVVVVGKDGRVDRIRLANVVRMSIAQ
jgi:hypothetical protein